jgi:hypothetical protein
MLLPDYLDSLPDSVVILFRQVEEDILEDMARRLLKAESVTDTAQWQAWRLEQLGETRQTIRYHLQRLTGKTQGELNALFQAAGGQALYYDDQIYRAVGLTPGKVNNSPALLNLLRAGARQTQKTFLNLTATTANTATQQFERALDRAWLQISSGAFDYQTAIRRAIKELASAGLQSITYPTGHTDALDVAVRRAVLTGVNQTAARLSEARAEEMGCDLVETTAHPGARPEHVRWQGKVFSRSGKSRKYPDFVSSTGYGTGPGLCGWNCRHSFFPYFEGLSESAYPRSKLREYEEKTVQYNSKTLSYYDATQQQRYIERQIRRWKREYLMLDAAGMDTTQASVKLAQWRATERDFCKQTGLDRDGFRSQAEGFGRSQAAKATARAERNHKTWLKSIGAEKTDLNTLAKYYDGKYNNSPSYQMLWRYARSVESGMLSPMAGIDLYQSIYQRIEKEIIGKKTTNGIVIQAQSRHLIERVLGTMRDPHKNRPRSGVAYDDFLECILHGTPRPIKISPDGKRSQLFCTEKCAVSINPDTGALIQCNPL